MRLKPRHWHLAAAILLGSTALIVAVVQGQWIGAGLLGAGAFVALVHWRAANLNSIFGFKQQIVVTEPDVQAAVAHLRSLPFMPLAPETWDRKRFIDQLAEAVAKAKVGDCIDVAPGVWAIIKPFGVDLSKRGTEPDGRLQVWLCVRAWGTDPGQVTILD